MKVRNLRECFDLHLSDRGSKRHRYDRVYGNLRPPKRMLEVGVLRGEGLAAWLEYFPATEFVVVDTLDYREPPAILRHPMVTWIRADSREVEPDGMFDIIIDDGAHDPACQAQTFQNLWKHCSGTYFIEDVIALDDMSNAQRVLFDKWVEKGWIDPKRHTPALYQELLDTLADHRVERHDLRDGHSLDSYILEITREP